MSEISQKTDTSVILVCAGNATRMGGVNKILLELGDTNVIGHSLRAFQNCPDVAEIIIVTKAENNDIIRETAAKLGVTKLAAITEGGDTRQKSVMEGLKLVSKRAMAMQKCCEEQPGGMAAVLGLDDKVA